MELLQLVANRETSTLTLTRLPGEDALKVETTSGDLFVLDIEEYR